MINNRIVLVLGAGASMPYHFPSGAELKAEVQSFGTVRESSPFGKTFQPNSFDEQLFSSFQRDLAQSPLNSIDAFLEARPEFLDIGKHTIALLLIRKENQNQFLTANIDPEENWYKYLFELMLDEGIENLSYNKLTVITFNYDRSFEYYFVSGLMATYGLSFDEAQQSMNFIKVIHVHGQLGELIEAGVTQSGRSYEPVANAERVRVAARGIKIISELSTDPTSDDWSGFRNAWRELEQARAIVFIGFGYNRNNVLRLLDCKVATDIEFLQPEVTGTVQGLTHSEIAVKVLPAFAERDVRFEPARNREAGALTYIRDTLHIFVKTRTSD